MHVEVTYLGTLASTQANQNEQSSMETTTSDKQHLVNILACYRIIRTAWYLGMKHVRSTSVSNINRIGLSPLPSGFGRSKASLQQTLRGKSRLASPFFCFVFLKKKKTWTSSHESLNGPGTYLQVPP